MAIKIKARGGETVEQMVRRFKKLCEKDGLTKEVKRRQYYEKPSELKRRATIRREGLRAIAARNAARPGARPGAPAARPAGRSGGRGS
ncbi:MAG: 30S ribosomal protein S21 [Phycisphaerales bacterium]|jgi:small subunit ribosomal protein S21